MTTPWKPSRIWAGETVFVFGGGPSLTPARAEMAKGNRCIAANHAMLLAPWADMLVAIDGSWPQEFRDFPGMRVTGCDVEDLDALYVGHEYDEIKVGENHTIHIRNSGLTAIRIALQLGAARMVLIGFDPSPEWAHFDGYPKEGAVGRNYAEGMVVGLANLIEQARAQGVIVEHIKDGAQ